MPPECKIGDFVIMYKAKSASVKYDNGVFAIYKVTNVNEELNAECRQYGGFVGNRGKLQYVEMELVKRFCELITAKAIRADAHLSGEACVKRNFQGTFFSASKPFFERLNKHYN